MFIALHKIWLSTKSTIRLTKSLGEFVIFACIGRAVCVYYSSRFAGLAQLVARNLAKVEVAGSNPVARSMNFRPVSIGLFYTASSARWPSGKAEACKAFIPGSNPGLASSERSKHLVPIGIRCFFESYYRTFCEDLYQVVKIYIKRCKEAL